MTIERLSLYRRARIASDQQAAGQVFRNVGVITSGQSELVLFVVDYVRRAGRRHGRLQSGEDLIVVRPEAEVHQASHIYERVVCSKDSAEELLPGRVVFAVSCHSLTVVVADIRVRDALHPQTIFKSARARVDVDAVQHHAACDEVKVQGTARRHGGTRNNVGACGTDVEGRRSRRVH